MGLVVMSPFGSIVALNSQRVLAIFGRATYGMAAFPPSMKTRRATFKMFEHARPIMELSHAYSTKRPWHPFFWSRAIPMGTSEVRTKGNSTGRMEAAFIA
eukprot:7681234-Pyramimonas_sp.AAC.1